MRERNCPIEIYYVYRDRVLESMWPRQAGWTCSTPSLGAKLNILDELRNKTCKMLNVDIKIQNILQQLENTVFETGNLVFQTDLSIICENYYWLMTIICSTTSLTPSTMEYSQNFEQSKISFLFDSSVRKSWEHLLQNFLCISSEIRNF